MFEKWWNPTDDRFGVGVTDDRGSCPHCDCRVLLSWTLGEDQDWGEDYLLEIKECPDCGAAVYWADNSPPLIMSKPRCQCYSPGVGHCESYDTLAYNGDGHWPDYLWLCDKHAKGCGGPCVMS